MKRGVISMTEKDFSEQKFDLSQNSFVIFMLAYAPGLVAGAITITYLGSWIPDVLQKCAYVILLIVMIIKAIMALQYNKSTLIINDNSIMVYLKKRKNNILLTKINKDDIEAIKQAGEQGFIVTKKNGQEEYISLSCYLKPYKALLYSVKAALFKIYGEERTNFLSDKLTMQYISSKKFPAELLKTDKENKSIRIFIVILSVILAGLPTIIGILEIISFILRILITFLQGFVSILSSM